MKLTRRILTLALVLVMVLAMAAPAMAAPGDFTITITNADTDSSAGHKYYAYQILAGKLDSTGKILTEITWGANITDGAAFIAALQAEADLIVDGTNIFASATNAEEVAEILAQAKYHTSKILNAFGKVATARVEADGVAAIASSANADAPYTIEIPADMAGYYLVKDDPEVLKDKEDVDGDGDTEEPLPNKDVSDYILQVVGNVTVEHKGSIPSMDKQVSESGESYHDAILSGINQTHHYRIVAELPDDYDAYDTYYLEFSDTMSKELTFEEVYSVYVVLRTGETTRIEVDPSCYTVDPDPIDPSAAKMPGGTHLRVILNDTKTLKAKETGLPITLTAVDAVVIRYTAHINSNAVVTPEGIPNEATLIYSNDPNTDGHGKTNPDETNVYPINLELLKVDGKDSTALNGAKFVLTRLYNEGAGTHTEYAKLDANKKLDSWVHHAEGDGCAADNAEHLAAVAAGEVGTVLITEAGKINVYGLDAGSYTLVEIEAPDGYNKLVEGIHFTVNATIDEAADVIASMTGTTNQGSITFDPAIATVQLTIPNYKGDVLPSTGGMGTTLFYVLGGMMVACAAVLLITKKRMAV